VVFALQAVTSNLPDTDSDTASTNIEATSSHAGDVDVKPTDRNDESDTSQKTHLSDDQQQMENLARQKQHRRLELEAAEQKKRLEVEQAKAEMAQKKKEEMERSREERKRMEAETERKRKAAEEEMKAELERKRREDEDVERKKLEAASAEQKMKDNSDTTSQQRSSPSLATGQLVSIVTSVTSLMLGHTAGWVTGGFLSDNLTQTRVTELYNNCY